MDKDSKASEWRKEVWVKIMQMYLFLMPGWVKDYTVCTKVCECVRILGECLVFHSREQCRWMQRDSGMYDKCLHPALIAQIEAVPHLSKLDVAVSSLWYDNGMLLSEGKCKLQAVIWWHAPADTALSLSFPLATAAASSTHTKAAHWWNYARVARVTDRCSPL